MNAADTTLRDFGRTAGIPDLAFDARGQVVFRTESGRMTGMERAGGDILVYATLPADYDTGAWLLRACKRAHHSRLEDWPIQPALRDLDGRPHLLALTRIAQDEFTTQRLNQALEYLSRWLDELRNEP